MLSIRSSRGNRAQATETVGPRAKHLLLGISLALWVLHVCLVARVFPASELLSDKPLMWIDSPFHQYQMLVADRLWQYHALSGYDPWFAAGSMAGVSYNASAKIPALLAMALLPRLGLFAIYKIYVFCCAILAPGLVLMAVRILRLPVKASAAAMTLGFLLWWISALHWYHTAGMVAFVIASYAALPYVALAWKGLQAEPSLSRALLLGLFGAVGLLIHPLFPIPVLFALLGLAAASPRQVNLKSLAILAMAVPALCLLPNLPWILDSLRYPGWSDGSLSPYQKAVDIGIAVQEALGGISGHARGARLNPVLLVFAVWAVFARTDRPDLRGLARGLSLGAVALIIFSAVGAGWPLAATLQPNRLSSAAYLILAVPAAIGLQGAVDQISHHSAHLRRLAIAATALAACSLLFFATELRNEVSAAPTPHYGLRPPEVAGPGPLTRWLEDWIRNNTSDDARILFETSPGRIHDNAHVSGYLVATTQREFIGGPYVFMHHAGFWDGEAFGSDLSRLSAADLKQQLVLYNIGWIISYSPKARQAFGAVPELKIAAVEGPLTIYEVLQPHNYLLQGSGRVASRGVNRLDLDHLSGDIVVLKYHYFPGLDAGPGIQVKAFPVQGDPVPFISLPHPPSSASLVFRVGR